MYDILHNNIHYLYIIKYWPVPLSNHSAQALFLYVPVQARARVHASPLQWVTGFLPQGQRRRQLSSWAKIKNEKSYTSAPRCTFYFNLWGDIYLSAMNFRVPHGKFLDWMKNY